MHYNVVLMRWERRLGICIILWVLTYAARKRPKASLYYSHIQGCRVSQTLRNGRRVQIRKFYLIFFDYLQYYSVLFSVGFDAQLPTIDGRRVTFGLCRVQSQAYVSSAFLCLVPRMQKRT